MKSISSVIEKSNRTTLKQSFINALKNKNFKDYISKLDIEEDILIKYTSSLEEVSQEEHNCSSCKGIFMCKNKIKGYKLSLERENNTLSFPYVMCEKKKKEEEDYKYLQNIKYYNISKELQEASFKNLYKDDVTRVPILKNMMEFIKKYENGEKVKGIFLTGSFGSGKTYLISALFNDMAKRNVKCAIVYYPELIRDLKASFNSKNYSEKFDYIKKSKMLLLDDIGAENVTNFNRDEVLGPILQYRMEQNLPTFFTSNLTLEELETNLSITSSGVDSIKARRIVERIRQLSDTMELVSKNRRV